jgi:predicted ATPase
MVIVSGEAGIGKSRITQAVIDAVANDDHTRMSYQCSPYHADSAFYPVIQQMSFAAGFAPSDSPDVRLDKLETLLGTDQGPLRLVAPLLGLDGVSPLWRIGPDAGTAAYPDDADAGWAAGATSDGKTCADGV